MIHRLLLPAAIVLGAFGLTGCMSTITYIPNDSNVQMSPTKARRVLAKNKVKIIDNKTVLLDQVYMGTWITEGNHTLSIPLKDIPVSSGHESCWYRCWPALQVPGNSRVFVNEPHLVAEAIYVVMRQAEKMGFAPAPKSEEVLFDEAATAYLAAAVKPELDADTRRFKVQAEDALREKRFEDTADLYGQALELAPWWPAGHYNRALVFSELQEYPDAIVEMKRYLRLAPDAANAGAAQDQVYKWEAKGKKG